MSDNYSRPCDKTLQQINTVFRDKCGGRFMQECRLESGLVQFWVVRNKVFVVHAYSGNNGWTHYNPSAMNDFKDVANEVMSIARG